jgi:plastocyanin
MLCCRVYPLLLVLHGLTACGSDDSGPNDTIPPTAAVDVGNVFFRSVHNSSINPAQDTVAVNGTVTWTWTQSGTHSVHFSDPSLPDGPAISGDGAQHSVTFSQIGTFAYACGIHGSEMVGTIVVR